MGVSTTLPVIDISDSPRARGRAHGESLRELVRDHVERFDQWASSAAGEPPADFRSALVTRTGFVRTAASYCPELLDETRGIADGAGITFEEAMCLQLMDESWWVARRRRATLAHRCSSIGVHLSDGRGSVIAQNMDLPHHMDGLQMVLRMQGRNDEPDVAVLSAAGMIALNGMNASGVAVSCNSLTQLECNADGLPVSFMIRSLLACESGETVAARLREWPHATALNYMVGDPDRIIDLECSAGATAEVAPSAAGLLLHTNHPLVNGDRDERDRALTNVERQEAEANTRARFDFLACGLERAGDVGVENIKALLASPQVPVCVPNRGEGWHTFASVVMECSDRTPLLQVTIPPAEAARYLTVSPLWTDA